MECTDRAQTGRTDNFRRHNTKRNVNHLSSMDVCCCVRTGSRGSSDDKEIVIWTTFSRISGGIYVHTDTTRACVLSPPPSSRLSVSLCPSSNRIRGFPNSPFSLPCILGRALQLALRLFTLSLSLCLSVSLPYKLRNCDVDCLSFAGKCFTVVLAMKCLECWSVSTSAKCK